MWPFPKPSVADSGPIEDRDRALEEFKADAASSAEYEKRSYDVAIGALERAKSGASAIQAASAAIAALYSGVLALVFSTEGATFPLRGVVSPIFLGLAVVLATYYLAFIAPVRDEAKVPPGGLAWQMNVHDRVSYVTRLVNTVVTRRSLAIRAAVVALAIGLAAMPLPFLSGDAFEQATSAATTTRHSATDDAVAGSGSGDESLAWPEPRLDLPMELATILYQEQLDKFVADLYEADRQQGEHSGYVESLDFFLMAVLLGAAVVALLPPLLLLLAGLVGKARERMSHT